MAIADQSTGSVSFVQESLVTSTKTYRSSVATKIDQGAGRIDFYLAMNEASLPHVVKFMVGGTPAENDLQVVRITPEGATTPKNYAHLAGSGETLGQILDNLVSRINLDPDVAANFEYASASNIGTVTLTSVSGRSFVSAVTGSSGSTTLSTPAVTQTGSGFTSSKVRLISSLTGSMSLQKNGGIQVGGAVRHWNGATAPVSLASNVLSASSHPKKLGTLITDNP